MNLPRICAGVPKIQIKLVNLFTDRGAPILILRVTV